MDDGEAVTASTNTPEGDPRPFGHGEFAPKKSGQFVHARTS